MYDIIEPAQMYRAQQKPPTKGVAMHMPHVSEKTNGSYTNQTRQVSGFRGEGARLLSAPAPVRELTSKKRKRREFFPLQLGKFLNELPKWEQVLLVFSFGSLAVTVILWLFL